MKKLLLTLLAGVCAGLPLPAATTINAVNHFAYGANLGWINWRGDVTDGAVIGAFVCSGFIYSANTGWIHLGDGTPANGVRYQNNSAADFGVNHDGIGNRAGSAYGANIGWLTFTNRAANGVAYDGPKVDLLTGKFSGFVWSANCGWISLSNAQAFVQTDTMDCGPDTDGDGLPDQWERQFAANLGLLHGAVDSDGDGVSNVEEFAADTNPLDPASSFRFTRINKPVAGSPVMLTWTSSATRQYRIRSSTVVTTPLPWPEIGLGLIPADAGATTTRLLAPLADPHRFYIIETIKPLEP